MNLLEGLHTYEIILLILGVLLFFVLLFVLIFFVIKNRPIKAVIPLFLVSVIMIGFPGIQKVKFDHGVLEFEKANKDYLKDPSNIKAKRELESKLSGIDAKRVTNPETIKKLEQAYTAIGEPRKATVLRKRLMTIKPKQD